MDNLEILQLTI